VNREDAKDTKKSRPQISQMTQIGKKLTFEVFLVGTMRLHSFSLRHDSWALASPENSSTL
jgi:hypothetical protein